MEEGAGSGVTAKVDCRRKKWWKEVDELKEVEDQEVKRGAEEEVEEQEVERKAGSNE